MLTEWLEELTALAAGQPLAARLICFSRVRERDTLSAELRESIRRIEENLRQAGYENVSHVVEFFGVAPEATTARSANVPVPRA